MIDYHITDGSQVGRASGWETSTIRVGSDLSQGHPVSCLRDLKNTRSSLKSFNNYNIKIYILTLDFKWTYGDGTKINNLCTVTITKFSVRLSYRLIKQTLYHRIKEISEANSKVNRYQELYPISLFFLYWYHITCI